MLGHFLRHLELLFFFCFPSFFLIFWLWNEMDVICRDDSRAEQTFFLPFQQHFCVSHDFLSRKNKRSHNSLGLLNHQITESWFYERSWWCWFWGIPRKKHNHVPVFYLVEHFRGSQLPGTITHQWRPTTDRGQINMRSLSATVTWCLENYEKIPKKGVTGQICSKMIHLCLLNEMMVDLK